MFGLKMSNVAYTKSYKEAVGFYLKSEPWRGADPDDERPMTGKRYRAYGVRMVGSDVVFRYHTTDVIVWHADNSYSINTGGYNTASTCTFANNFMPARHHLIRDTNVLCVDGAAYAFPGHRISVSSDGTPSGDGLGLFTRKTINRKMSRKLLGEHSYPAYREWYKTMNPLIHGSYPYKWDNKFTDSRAVIAALRCPEMWHELMMSQVGSPDEVRKAIYRERGASFGIYNYETLNELEDWKTYEKYEVEI